MATAELVQMYRLIIDIAAVGLVIDTFETLSILKAFNRDGLFSWQVVSLRIGAISLARTISRPLDVLAAPGTVRAICFARLVALGLILLSSPTTWLSYLCALVICFSLFFSTWRRLLGDDGSDQMNVLIFATASICTWPGTTGSVLEMGLWFIALQCCLSYFAAGIAKLLGSQWRSGAALPAIWDNYSYGIEAVVTVLKRSKLLGLVLCWSVILFEILFSLCLFSGFRVCLAFLFTGAVFHLSCAVIMGLNSFLWAFLATYPAVFFVWRIIHAQ